VQASFSGGHVYLAQWYDDTRDYDLTCGSYGFTPLAVPPSSLSNSTAEFSGDWNNDVLARVAASGDLLLYRGQGNGAPSPGVRIGSGWQVMNALDTVGDVSGDGAQDVVTRKASTGQLLLYPGNGRGGFGTAKVIGTGWNAMSAIVGVGDLTGDQRPDLLARQASNGFLWLYPGNGVGGWSPRMQVGSGWNVMDAILGPGDLTGDGRADVLARESATGFLWLYPGNGANGFGARVRVGSGWNAMSAIAAAGDLDGDRAADLLARDGATGDLWLYPGNGAGGWQPRVRVGSGWQVMNALF
jgi:hypothetical protein